MSEFQTQTITALPRRSCSETRRRVSHFASLSDSRSMRLSSVPSMSEFSTARLESGFGSDGVGAAFLAGFAFSGALADGAAGSGFSAAADSSGSGSPFSPRQRSTSASVQSRATK